MVSARLRASYSDNNIRKTFYKRVEAPQDGFLKIIPTTGAHFFNCSYFGGVEYAANYRFETGNRLATYEDKVSTSLNRILRHNVGKVSDSLPQKEEQMIRVHGMSMRRTFA